MENEDGSTRMPDRAAIYKYTLLYRFFFLWSFLGFMHQLTGGLCNYGCIKPRIILEFYCLVVVGTVATIMLPLTNRAAKRTSA